MGRFNQWEVEEDILDLRHRVGKLGKSLTSYRSGFSHKKLNSGLAALDYKWQVVYIC